MGRNFYIFPDATGLFFGRFGPPEHTLKNTFFLKMSPRRVGTSEQSCRRDGSLPEKFCTACPHSQSQRASSAIQLWVSLLLLDNFAGKATDPPRSLNPGGLCSGTMGDHRHMSLPEDSCAACPHTESRKALSAPQLCLLLLWLNAFTGKATDPQK